MTVDEEQCLERHGQNGHKVSYSKGGFPTHPSFSLETTNFARAERPHDSKPPSLPGHFAAHSEEGSESLKMEKEGTAKLIPQVEPLQPSDYS